jgi:hypothetical protein
VKRYRISSTLTSADHVLKLAQELDAVTNSTVGYSCNSSKNLACMEATGTCGCAIYDTNKIPFNATFVREGNGCRASIGSTCWPLDNEDGQEGDTCAFGTSCLISKSRRRRQRRCTLDNVMTALVRARLVDPEGGEERYFRDYYNSVIGGFCKCSKYTNRSAYVRPNERSA